MQSPDKNQTESNSTLADVFYVLLSIFVSLLIGELVVRAISAKKLIYNIEMVKYAKTLKIPDPDKFASHVHRPNASAELMGVEIKLNSLGNRSKELSAEKDPNTTRILVLGSSVTMGWGVAQEKIFTSLAEVELNQPPLRLGKKVEIVNAGIGNYNTLFQSKLFHRQYPQVRPDLVVLHYFISDAEARTQGNNNLLLKYSYFADLIFDQVSKFQFKISGKKDLSKYYQDLYSESNPQWTQTLSLIQEMNQTLGKDKVPLLVMIVPDFNNLAENSAYKAIYQKISSTLQSSGIPVFNMFDEFTKRFAGHERDLWIQADDPHPNHVGHRAMADLLEEFLIQKAKQNFAAPALKSGATK